MSTFTNTLTALALSAAAVSASAPLGAPVAHAQSVPSLSELYSGYLARHTTSTSRDYSSRSRYSSAVQREINKLDDDPVEDIPVPVLLGVSLSSVSPNFGDPRGGGTRLHEGEDIMAPMGTPIASPTDAVVVRTGNGDSSGITVTTANPGGETFIYMHLDSIAEGIKAGTVLKEGQILGFVGDTGNAKGGAPHLHFEIRKNREATDPFPRLARSFTHEERMESIEAYLKKLDNDDAEEFAEDMVAIQRSAFVSARSVGIELPDEITEALGGTSSSGTTAVIGARDLTLGSEGDDVVALQTALIAKGFTIPAGATGYFGAQTQTALRQYQVANGISPASGYFGPLTRAKLALK